MLSVRPICSLIHRGTHCVQTLHCKGTRRPMIARPRKKANQSKNAVCYLIVALLKPFLFICDYQTLVQMYSFLSSYSLYWLLFISQQKEIFFDWWSQTSTLLLWMLDCKNQGSNHWLFVLFNRINKQIKKKLFFWTWLLLIPDWVIAFLQLEPQSILLKFNIKLTPSIIYWSKRINELYFWKLIGENGENKEKCLCNDEV